MNDPVKVPDAWNAIEGRRPGKRFSWRETLKYIAFTYHQDVREALHSGQSWSRVSRLLHETTLNRLMYSILCSPMWLHVTTDVFPGRRRIVIPYMYPGPPPTEAVFCSRWADADDVQDADDDPIPLYEAKVVSYHRHSITFDVGNRYVPARRFTLPLMQSDAINAMYDSGHSIYEQPEPVDLAALIDHLVPYLQHAVHCVSKVLAKHPLHGLEKSRTRRHSVFK